MSLTIRSRKENNRTILELTGSLTLSPSLHIVRDAVRQLLLHTDPVVEIVLDLTGVTAVDSSGLGELTVIYTLAKQRNCSLRLARVSPSVKKLMAISHADELLL